MLVEMKCAQVYPVLTTGKVPDGVFTMPWRKDKPISARSACQQVIPDAAIQAVGPYPTINGIVTRAAQHYEKVKYLLCFRDFKILLR